MCLIACVALVGWVVPARGIAIPLPPPGPTASVVPLPLAVPGTYQTSEKWVIVTRGARQIRVFLVLPKVPVDRAVPVVEFAHGWNATPLMYRALLTAWSSAGMLVVAPMSPGMARGTAASSQSHAIGAQIDDLPVVLTDVLALSLSVHADSTRIALAGHSDGGTSVATIAFNPTFHDSRIGAFLILAGGTSRANSGPMEWRGNTAPVLIADSVADQFGNWPCAVKFYRQAAAPKVRIAIRQHEQHLPPWSTPTALHRRIWSATVHFMQWGFSKNPRMIGAMHHDLSISSVGINLTPPH